MSNPSLTPHDMCRRQGQWVTVVDSVSRVVTVTMGGDTDIGRQCMTAETVGGSDSG